MNILHIVSAKKWGGGEQYVVNLVNETNRQGDKAFIAVDERHPGTAKRFEEITPTIKLNLSRIHQLSALFQLRQFIKDQHIDVINFHGGKIATFCVLLSKFTGVPCVFFKHNVVKGKRDFYHTWLNNNLAKIVCVSRATYEAQLQNLPEHLKSKFVCIPNGIPIPAQETISPLPAQFCIGYCGQIQDYKGVHLLLEALTQLGHNVRCLIAGAINNDYARALERQYASDKIVFLGHQTDLSGFYNQISCLVAPTLVPESFGLVIAEAMSYQRPAVACAQGGPLDIIDDHVNGLLIKPNSVDAIVEALKTLEENGNTVNTQWGNAAREKIKALFSIERLYRDLHDVYASLIAKH